MSEYELNADKGFIALDGWEKRVGVVNHTAVLNNQTRRTVFDPHALVNWAKTVREAYGSRAELVFTPGMPLVAESPDDDATIGIAVTPCLPPEEVDDDGA